MTDQLLSAREAAAIMGVVPATIHRHVRNGNIPRVGRKISKYWIEDYLARQNLPLCSHCRRCKVSNPGDTMCVVCEDYRLDGKNE